MLWNSRKLQQMYGILVLTDAPWNALLYLKSVFWCRMQYFANDIDRGSSIKVFSLLFRIKIVQNNNIIRPKKITTRIFSHYLNSYNMNSKIAFCCSRVNIWRKKNSFLSVNTNYQAKNVMYKSYIRDMIKGKWDEIYRKIFQILN